jgi:asparagine synthase (glutamine-hydrolysing)
MCGILFWWGQLDDVHPAIQALMARGPDNNTTEFFRFGSTQGALGFTRLHIQGDSGAEQPFKMTDGRIVMCNGEIFNSKTLIERLSLQVPAGASDCAVIPALLATKTLEEVARLLDGDFAIIVIDPAGTVEVARDPYGVRPLFYAESPTARGFASEIKALPIATAIRAIEPGTVVRIGPSGLETRVWHQVPWLKHPCIQYMSEKSLYESMRHTFEEAVAKRMTTVREIGACLSGGLDSSLVAAVAARILGKSGKRLHTYSIGMEGSPDLEHARLVATHIHSIHHERIVTAKECLDAIPTVIKAIESYDITTVRASVGNYLLGRLVVEETPNVKVVLNGDGADEAMGGYLYMRAAPDDAAFEAETDRLLREIHQYDVLRSERCMAAHGLESRSPFLDRQFISFVRSIPTEFMRPRDLEKAVIRVAYADTGLLPLKVLLRRKEAFSDGISRKENSWFEMARIAGESAAGDWKTRAASYKINTPPTAEALWYRELFHCDYPAAAAVITAMWMPRWVGASDPSARTLNLYNQTNQTKSA